MKKLISLIAGLALMPCANFTAYAEQNIYPQTEGEYDNFRNAYYDMYMVNGDSVYFLDRDIYAEKTSFTVSSDSESDVKRETYGFIFTPENDGRYVVSIEGKEELYVWLEEPVDGVPEITVTYPEIYNYIVEVENGEIKVDYDGKSGFYETYNYENKNLTDFPDKSYFSYVNGFIRSENYITNVYSENDVTSYFCVNSGYEEDITDMVKVSYEKIAVYDGCEWVSSAIGHDDIQNLYKIKALSDGDVNVTADGKTYRLTVNNGIFSYRNYIDDVLIGDVNNDGNFNIADAVTLQEWLLNKPDVEISAEASDFNNDDIIDVFDFCMLKKSLSDFVRNNSVPVLVSVNYDTYIDYTYGWYTNLSVNVIDMNGNEYTKDFGKYTGDENNEKFISMADEIIKDGHQKYLDEKNDGLVNDIKYIAENAEKYKNCEMIRNIGGWEDYGENYLYLLYDDNGEKKYLELCRFGGEFAWLDNEEIQQFVIKLVENNLFADKHSFEITLEYMAENAAQN
ncbi:MAG: dockerin type I repeat-containing protein [Ruminococcus sp.]|nr:dockerin type I repeat-containing protein [Ruminococcus sp.]